MATVNAGSLRAPVAYVDAQENAILNRQLSASARFAMAMVPMPVVRAFLTCIVGPL